MAKLDHNKLAKVLALAGSDQDGEALSALRAAQGMLKAAGKTFADLSMPAPTSSTKPSVKTSSGPTFVDIFAGFDDHMEAKEPGWKAKQAAARVDRLKREAAEREAAIAKYGSERAAKMPTARELVLNKATAHLKRKVQRPGFNGRPYAADTLDGWSWLSGTMPNSVRLAVADAYPMPTTLREAREEYRSWRVRDRELERVWCPPGECGGDTYLSLPASARMDVVSALWRKGPIVTLDDLLVRIEVGVEDKDWADEAAPSILEAFNRLVLGGAGDIEAVAAAGGVA